MQKLPKVTLRWFRSTLLIVGMVLLLCCAVFLYNLATLRSTLYQTSDNLADYLQNSMDARLLEIVKSSAAIELNTVNAELKKRDTPIDRVTGSMYRFANYMDTYQTGKDAINAIYIYYPALNYVVGSEGCYPANSYYCLTNELQSNGMAQWLAALKGADSGYLFLPYTSGERFCYLRRMLSEGKDVGTLVLELNTDALFDTESIAIHTPSGTLMGMTLGDRAIAFNNDVFPQAWTQTLSHPRTYSCATRASAVSALSYTLLFGKLALLRPMTVSLLISVVGVLLCLVISLIVSAKLSRSHAKPVKELMDCLGVPSSGNQDEFSTMQTRIVQMQDEQQSAQAELDQKQNSIDSLFLNYVLMGDLRSETELEAAAARYRIAFPHHHFRVGIISPASAAAEGRQDAIRQWFIDKQVCTMLIYQESQYILLFNIEKNTQTRLLTSQMTKLVETLFPEGATATLGHSYSCLSGISTSYCEALHALAHSTPNQTTVYKDSLALLPASELPASAWLTSLYADLQQRDYDACMSKLKNGLDEYISAQDTPAMRRVKLAALQNALLALRRDGVNEGVFSESQFSSQDILRCTSSAELRSVALSLLGHLKQSETASQQSAAQRAQSIIRRSFTNPELGLYLLADELKVNNTYLSSTFKSEYGIGVVQYITQLRIEYSKKLLTTTDRNIKDIAQAVGFSSDISFIRAFKRVEGTTPSALRKPSES